MAANNKSRFDTRKPKINKQTYEAIAVGLQQMLTTERGKVVDLLDTLNKVNKRVYGNTVEVGTSPYHELRELIVSAVRRNGGAVS